MSNPHTPITVHSSAGDYFVMPSGLVAGRPETDPDDPAPDILRFDLEEHQNFYGLSEPLSDYDILDLAYFFLANGKVCYEKPSPPFAGNLDSSRTLAGRASTFARPKFNPATFEESPPSNPFRPVS